LAVDEYDPARFNELVKIKVHPRVAVEWLLNRPKRAHVAKPTCGKGVPLFPQRAQPRSLPQAPQPKKRSGHFFVLNRGFLAGATGRPVNVPLLLQRRQPQMAADWTNHEN
jgi:hypothetical protein